MILMYTYDPILVAFCDCYMQSSSSTHKNNVDNPKHTQNMLQEMVSKLNIIMTYETSNCLNPYMTSHVIEFFIFFGGGFTM